MTGIIYLDYETVVAINAEHGGSGAGVRDAHGIRGALSRAESSFDGYDPHPSLVSKAAALLHGLSSTQYFFDGNKRTAWLSAKLFLALNGHHLREMEDVLGESLVLGIARNSFGANDSDSAIKAASEWYEAQRLRAADRIEYALVGNQARHTEFGTFDLLGGQSGGFYSPAFPVLAKIALVTRIKWRKVDLGIDWVLRISVSNASGSTKFLVLSGEELRMVAEGKITQPQPQMYRSFVEDEVSAGLDTGGEHEFGMIPSLYLANLQVAIAAPEPFVITVSLNGEVAADRPMTVDQVTSTELDPESFH